MGDTFGRLSTKLYRAENKRDIKSIQEEVKRSFYGLFIDSSPYLTLHSAEW